MTPIAGKAVHAPRDAKRHVSGGLIVALGLAGLMVLGAAVYVAFILWPRWPGPAAAPDAPALPITIAGVSFNVPPAAIRVPQQRYPGAQERIELSFLWPSLAAPDPAARPPPTEAPIAPDRLFVTIVGSSGALPPTERMKTIYPRYFAEGQFVGPDGLIGSGFRDGTPYQGEDLFYDGAAPDHFLARCSRAGAGATPGTCLLERRVGAADITIRFPRDWLGEWRELADGVDRLIASLRPAG